jgi:hypothetical protein
MLKCKKQAFGVWLRHAGFTAENAQHFLTKNVEAADQTKA